MSVYGDPKYKYRQMLISGRHATRFTFVNDRGERIVEHIVPAMTEMMYDWPPEGLPPKGEWKVEELILESIKTKDTEVLIRNMLTGILEDLSNTWDEDGKYRAIDKAEISLEYLNRYKRVWMEKDGVKTWYRLVPDHDVRDAD